MWQRGRLTTAKLLVQIPAVPPKILLGQGPPIRGGAKIPRNPKKNICITYTPNSAKPFPGSSAVAFALPKLTAGRTWIESPQGGDNEIEMKGLGT